MASENLDPQELKRTVLYDEHKKLGAKLVPFAGWEMPVLYSGLIAEHNAVRNAAGLFDVCHMGEILVEGPEAELAIEEMTCNKVESLYDGKAQYNAIINQKGGVEDDIIIYRYSQNKFLICVNASNAKKDFEWFIKNNKRDAKFSDLSEDYGLIAFQGPKAVEIIKTINGLSPAAELKRFHFKEVTVQGVKIIAARTGYTGEDGFELFTPSNSTALIWNILLESGQGQGLIPCGLGARDTLRLEACYPLHGHELSPEISAVESGLAWIVKTDKPDYPGKSVLTEQIKNGSENKLIGFFVEESGIVREQSKVFNLENQEIGYVTSGTKTPTVNKALGLAIIKSEHSELDTKIKIQVRDKYLNCKVVKTPFYKASN